jgi:hypothetical protein
MDSQTDKYLISPALVGLSAAGLVAGIYGTGGKMSLPVVGEVSPVLGVGLLGFASDIVGTAVTDAISEANQVQELDEFQRRALKPAITGGAFVGAARLAGGAFADNMAIARVGGVGVASSVAGSYLSEMIPSEDK